jgi:3-phosphoshikimate 1-carboxyvinyltransferase
MNVTIEKATRIRGTIRVPGDKSIAHRALILGALASGEQTVAGVPRSGDLESTAACLRALGCRVTDLRDERVVVSAEDWRKAPTLAAGNSGTTARLLAGLVAGLGIACTIDGDGSLRKRPMARIAEPLTLMGADIRTAPEGRLPMRIRSGKLTGITYRLPVASAQVKSAILIAGLRASGNTTVIEGAATRDHTEQMLAAMGVAVERHAGAVTVSGGARLNGIPITVPGDISSASFFIALAAAHPDAEVRVPRTGINPTRTGILDVLREMGAHITLENSQTCAGERMADILIRSGALRGVEIAGPMIPSLIDELPILAVVATQAEGITTIRDAAELRHKESDRIRTTVENLSRLGADIEEREDGLVVRGPCRLKGHAVSSHGDHRIAMAMAVAGLIAEGSTEVMNSEIAAISYPDFLRDLGSLAC